MRNEGLSEARAWAIATITGSVLRGRVALVSTGEEADAFEVVHSYNWVQIQIPQRAQAPSPQDSLTLQWVRKAREACVVWHLLSYCDGFSGEKNGAFWKRVVDALYDIPPYTDPSYFARDPTRSLEQFGTRPVRHPDDAHGFFDMPGETFPRFRLFIPLTRPRQTDETFWVGRI